MLNTIHDTLTNPQVSKRLRTRLWLFGVIALALCGLIIHDVWRGDASWWSVLIAFAIGLGVGVPLGRLLTIKWHQTRDEVVSQLDLIGSSALVLYIAFDIARDWLLGHWFSGADLAAIAFAVLAGALLGRFIGIHISVQRVLETPRPQ